MKRPFLLGHKSRPSPNGLAETIQAIQARGGILIGSFGRAAIFRLLAGNAELEFTARGENPLLNAHGGLRDIDVIGPANFVDHTWTRRLPHPVDGVAFYGPGIQLALEDSGLWSLRSYVHRQQILLDPSVLEPVESETAYGIPCRTVSAAAHIALAGAFCERPQDWLTQAMLMDAMPRDQIEQLSFGVYEPLYNLRPKHQG